ncbi:MAG: hypothetical protein K2K73_02945 [Ureaplasma sp.]|nr:hypothetical protein [Ureaplasma sp.]
MKNNLYLDMVLDSCNFVLFDENQKIIDQFYIKTHNNLIDNVIVLLNNFLQKNNLHYHNLNNLYVNIGPGSFTGTKAIVNIAKTIKSVFNDIELYTITNDLVFNKGNGIAIIDAKSKKFYVSVYENSIEKFKLSIIDNNEKNKLINDFSHLEIFDELNTNPIDRSKVIIEHLELFKKCDNYLELKPEYIKSALN